MSGLLLLDRLSDTDLSLLARAAGEPGSARERVDELRSDPRRIEALIRAPAVFDALFGPEKVFLPAVAPFLAFSVLIERAALLLGEVAFVPEWVGPQTRVPVFDVENLREFISDPLRRFFLAELLTSYTHVASGSVLVRTPRGWKRRRFSELDPVRLAELIEATPQDGRVILYRRFGDLALFLTGVFPDHTARRRLAPIQRGRLRRAFASVEPGDGDPDDVMPLFEALGRRAYRAAWEATQPRDAGSARVLGEVAERFLSARRILNVVTDQHLFPFRTQWFGAGA
jgi:hypothetical protein